MSDTFAEFSSIPFELSVFKAFIQILSRIGVPIFLMITGALLLSRDYSNKENVDKFYRHNWLSLFITAEIWYLIIFLCKSMSKSSIFHTKGILPGLIQLFCNQLFINQDTFRCMWYMAMIICVYLIIPFIALGIQKIERKYLYIPLTIALISGFVIPNVNSCISLVNGSNTVKIDFALSINNIFSIYIIYILIGYWINKGLIKKLSNKLIIFFSFLFFSLTIGYQLWAFSRPFTYIVRYNSIGILLTSCFFFEFFRRFNHWFKSLEKPITYLSTISFGIYFVHRCIMQGLPKFLSIKSLGHIPYFFLLVIISFVGSIIIIQLLRRFKTISRLLFRI